MTRRALGGALELLATLFTIGLIAYACFVLGGRFRAATPPARRILLPVYAAGFATLLTLLLANVLEQVNSGAVDVVGPIFLVFLASVPFAFLFGILRSRLARAPSPGLMVSLDTAGPSAPRSPTRSAIARSASRSGFRSAAGGSTVTGARST